MKVVFTAIGTSGDIHPFIALGRALNVQGREVSIRSYNLHETKCADASVKLRAVAPDADRRSLT